MSDHILRLFAGGASVIILGVVWFSFVTRTLRPALSSGKTSAKLWTGTGMLLVITGTLVWYLGSQSAFRNQTPPRMRSVATEPAAVTVPQIVRYPQESSDQRARRLQEASEKESNEIKERFKRLPPANATNR